VSCYVCHYNIPAVHNELQNPSPARVNWWLRSTTVSASLFYMAIGLAGSAYGHCTPTGKVEGNVLLDFDEDDPLLLVGRMCLACTITLAFPLLVIPARDILLRSWFATSTTTTTVSVTTTTHHSHRHTASHTRSSARQETTTTNGTADSTLCEPLLANDHQEEARQQEQPQQTPEEEDDEAGSDTVTTRATATAAARSVIAQPQQHSFAIRLGTAILVLWSAAAVASCVKSIDIVWDLLGSSLSIFLSYLIPCGSFVTIVGRLGETDVDGENDEDDDEEDAGEAGGSGPAGASRNRNRSHWKRKAALSVAWTMLIVYIPLMIISTANAFYDTFFKH
jgi:amino acid permease